MFVDLQDLTNRLGADRVLQLLDHDGDGVADERLTAEVLADADADVSSILYGKGFSADHIRGLAGDPLLRRHATTIAMAYAGQTKSEFIDASGKGPYDDVAERARKLIREVAEGAKRAMRGEMQSGANTLLRGETFEPTPPKYFIETPDKPRGPGGF